MDPGGPDALPANPGQPAQQCHALHRAGGTGGAGGTLPGGRGLCLRVRDNGVGIAAEDIPRALEPFRQVGDPFSRSSTGTGLGLPIAKGLAEAHGGSLQIDSVPGIGTTITVLLPAECVAAGGPPQG